MNELRFQGINPITSAVIDHLSNLLDVTNKKKDFLDSILATSCFETGKQENKAKSFSDMREENKIVDKKYSQVIIRS